jgi:multicomponent Na+:H+ antiporter subunit G
MTTQSLTAQGLVALGTLLILLAALGLVRLPDVYARINAVTKAAGLGTSCLLLGVLVWAPSADSARTLVLAVLLQLCTTPIAGYAVARAAHRSGAPLAAQTHHNELTEEREREP